MLSNELVFGRPLVNVTDRTLHIVFTVPRGGKHRSGTLATDTRREKVKTELIIVFQAVVWTARVLFEDEVEPTAKVSLVDLRQLVGQNLAMLAVRQRLRGLIAVSLFGLIFHVALI